MTDESGASGVPGGDGELPSTRGDSELPSFHEALEESSDEEPGLQGEEDGDARQGAGGIEMVMCHVGCASAGARCRC